VSTEFVEGGSPGWFTAAIANPPERGWIDHEGAAVELLTWGDPGAPGLIFTHGIRAHADWWSHIAPLMAEGRRVACLSWSGMGRSGWRERYTLDQYLTELMAATEAAGLFQAAVKPTIVGHSFGGYIAAMAAARHGERFNGAVIVDSSLRPEQSGWPDIAPPRTYVSYAEARRRFRFSPPQPCEPYVEDWLAEHALGEVEGIDGRRRWAWRFDPRLYERLEYQNVWELLSRPRCPLAFVRGGRSAVVTETLAARQAAQAPAGSPYLVVEDAAHHLMADRPLELVRALEQVLGGWSGGK
jgi:pimeloyl-ACP methyl ester carboxylesterase